MIQPTFPRPTLTYCISEAIRKLLEGKHQSSCYRKICHNCTGCAFSSAGWCSISAWMVNASSVYQLVQSIGLLVVPSFTRAVGVCLLDFLDVLAYIVSINWSVSQFIRQFGYVLSTTCIQLCATGWCIWHPNTSCGIVNEWPPNDVEPVY